MVRVNQYGILSIVIVAFAVNLAAQTLPPSTSFAGNYFLTWTARAISSGVYLVQLNSSVSSTTQKVLFLK